MRKRSSTVAVALAACLLMTAGVSLADTGGIASGDDHGDARQFTFAVIGDIPYGDGQIAAFPGRIDQLNADRQVQLVDHLGDIKSGSSVCSDDYFAAIRKQFDRITDPLVYTPGDNEWTDCHRPNNGGYNPLERLDKVRSTFFPSPGRTLGKHPVKVTSQLDQGYPENVSYDRAGVSFAAVHIVGSNNSLLPWTSNTTATPEQTSEVLGRTAADVGLIRGTFAHARSTRARAVVLLTQADMFDPTVTDPQFSDYFGFQPIVRAIAEESARFAGRVYLFNGDSHVYNEDHPLDIGSHWLASYGVKSPATNLTRITVEGSTAVDEWLKVTVDKHDRAVMTIQRIPFS